MSAVLEREPTLVARKPVVVVTGSGRAEADPSDVIARFEAAIDALELDAPARWLVDDPDGTLAAVGDWLWRNGEEVSSVTADLPDGRRHGLLVAAADAVVVIAPPHGVPARVVRGAMDLDLPLSVQHL